MMPENAREPSLGCWRGIGGGTPVSSSARNRLGGRGGEAGSSWLAVATAGSWCERRGACGVSGVITSVRDFAAAG
jgi:hypothetical protein